MTHVRSTNDTINISEFEWFLPSPRKPILAITIPNDNCFNLNQNLCIQIPKHIRIGLSSDGKRLALKEETEEGYFVPKSGGIKDSVLVQEIKTRGVRLPANYLVESINEYWVATLVPPISSPTLPKKTPKRPRTNGLKDMLPAKANKL